MMIYNEPLDELFRSLLPLHEVRIEERLKGSGIDLNEFLDYTQIRLNRFMDDQRYLESLRVTSPRMVKFWSNSSGIDDTKKIQSVVIKMLEGNSTKTKRLDQKLIALIYHEKDEMITPQNMDAIASNYGYTEKHSGKKIKDLFNKLSKDAVYLKEQREKYGNQIKSE